MTHRKLFYSLWLDGWLVILGAWVASSYWSSNLWVAIGSAGYGFESKDSSLYLGYVEKLPVISFIGRPGTPPRHFYHFREPGDFCGVPAEFFPTKPRKVDHPIGRPVLLGFSWPFLGVLWLFFVLALGFRWTVLDRKRKRELSVMPGNEGS